jgi:hypothetical protein
VRRPRLRPALATLIGTVVVTAAALVVPFLPASSASAADSQRDGTTGSRAVASCWEAKQVNAAAVDGLYWLYTPALQRPQQFWCDMTTDGGGWVLIGRGRQGWDFTAEGQGSPTTVSTTVTGTGAFAPAHLTDDLVDALLDERAPSALDDGLRVRRAKDAAGSRWQELRLTFSAMTTWSWAIGGGYPLASWSVDGTVRAGGSSRSFCADSAYQCVVTSRSKTNKYLPGFAYGPSVTGRTSASSYLWAATDGGGSATPFAQAYLRPKLRLADLAFPAMPAGGLPGATNRVLFDNYAKPQTYGVSGLANGFSTERDTEVRSMTQIGDTMFVGGNFAKVDNYADGTSVTQSYLAAFDASTGDRIPSFRPTLNGKVNAVVKLPSGLLAVGGEFTIVNGTPHAGLVVLDPATGAIATGFGVAMEYRSSAGTKGGTVTALGVQGSWLYVGGTFTHVAGGNPIGGFVYAKRGVRLNIASGRPDSTWNPAFNAAPIFLTTSSSADRVYYGGFFTTMKDGATPAERFVTLTTASPVAPVGGLVNWVGSTEPRSYQQTGVETADRFWLGGSEHMFYDFNRDFSLVRPNIARGDDGPGGDFQASVVENAVAYGSCHCDLSYVYGNSRTWNLPSNYDRIDTMRYVAAFDVATGRDIPDYLPWISTRAARGPWALTVDSDGCLWVGGDLTNTKRATDSAWQSSGGFARFCRADSTAPTVPSGTTTTKNADGTVKVSWTGSTDNASGTIKYTVFRDNLAVATVTGWSVTLPAVTGTSTYAVRAFDKAGNTSATTPPLPVTVP